MANGSGDSRRFAVALSFPGEHRKFVRNVAERLAELLGGRERVFFDEWHKAELLGQNFDTKLRKIFRDESELVVAFFSEYYTKPWCNVEWHSIRSILFERMADDAVVAVHLDGTIVDGWEKIDLGIRRSGRPGAAIADEIAQRYRLQHPVRDARGDAPPAGPHPDSSPADAARRGRSPDTPELISVFVCYHTNDLEIAREVKRRLSEHHPSEGMPPFRAWIAADEIGAGDNWQQEIDESLRKAHAVIVVVSPDSCRSMYATYEWAHAIGHGTPVVPIVWKKSDLHPRLRLLHHLSFIDTRVQPWERLFDDLSRKLAVGSTGMTPKPAEINVLREEVASQVGTDSSYLVQHPPGGKAPPPKDVFLVIDVQQDFFEGGALPVIGAETLIEPLNQAIALAVGSGMKVIFSRDWHPKRHRSFLNASPDGAWPEHCVQETPGARFHAGLKVPRDARIVSIGVDNSRLGYSAFEDESMVRRASSPDFGTLYIAGIALEYCVQATALEAAGKYGKRVVILEPLVRAATRDQAKLAQLWSYLESQGIQRHSGPPSFGRREAKLATTP
jgi:nicotinamidase/pyrazinamidase